MERLDKILSEAGLGSRKQCTTLVRRGYVTVNGQVVRDASLKVSSESRIECDGREVERRRPVVLIMNKRSGLVTSTEDNRNSTVMEDIPASYAMQDLLPVGRLDKDTEGLLVFSNDGDLIHRLISPKHEVPKVYYVEHTGLITEDHIKQAAQGIELKDGTICKSAQLVPLSEGKSYILIREGMYHQVKRMYGALSCKVLYLKRVQIGSLNLGSLQPGCTRELTEEEIEQLFDKNAVISL